MECEKCGAVLGFGADTCAECGAPVDRPAGAAPPVVMATAADAPAAAGVSAPAAKSASKPAWLVPVVAAIAIVLIAGGYLVFKGLSGANGPDAAALRMLNGFANYDAAAILDNATHASLTATDQAQFAQETANAKKDNKGLAAVRNVKVVGVTLDAKDPNAATVKLSAEWLTDAAKKTYTARTETLTMVKQDGRWLVRLFQ